MPTKRMKNNRPAGNDYGIFGVFADGRDSLEPIAVVESNRAGVYEWVRVNALPGNYRIVGLPEIEIFDTKDDFPPGMGLNIDEVVKKSITRMRVPAQKKATATRQFATNQAKKQRTQGRTPKVTCSGSHLFMGLSFAHLKVRCDKCGKMMSVTTGGWMRKHSV